MLYLRGLEQLDEAADEADYTRRIPAVAALKRLEFRCPVTFFVGENGSVKSTLLEAIAVAWGFNPEGGSRNFRFSSRDTHSGLYRRLRLVRGSCIAQDGYFLRSESLYNMASYVDELAGGDRGFLRQFGGRSLHGRSHGESLLALAQNRFRRQGLYLLDEPEAALSPVRQLTFLALLHRLASEGSQLIVATHSPILMACPRAEILRFDGAAGITPVAWQETEHVQITRDFLAAPERMMRVLFAEGGEEEA